MQTEVEVQKVRGVDDGMCESFCLKSLSMRNRNVAAGTVLPWMMTLVFHSVTHTSQQSFSPSFIFPLMCPFFTTRNCNTRSVAQGIASIQMSGGLTRGRCSDVAELNRESHPFYIPSRVGENLGLNMLKYSNEKNPILFFIILSWYCLSKPFTFRKKPVFHVKGVMSPEHQQN